MHDGEHARRRPSSARLGLEHARKIAQAPLGYVERPELKKGIRSCVHGAYVIFFTVDDQGVRIERILHGARDMGPLLNQ